MAKLFFGRWSDEGCQGTLFVTIKLSSGCMGHGSKLLPDGESVRNKAKTSANVLKTVRTVGGPRPGGAAAVGCHISRSIEPCHESSHHGAHYEPKYFLHGFSVVLRGKHGCQPIKTYKLVDVDLRTPHDSGGSPE